MESLTATLQAAQQARVTDALVKIVLTSGEDTHTFTKSRILDINHPEEPYSQEAELILHNRDGALTELAFKGFKGVISYGAITPAGEEYEARPPLWVIAQTFGSTQGELTCHLSLIGIPNLMAQDKASAAYQPDETDTKSAKTLIDAIAGATLACFNHCTAYEVVWEDGYNDLADTWQPKDSFRVYTGGNRLSALRGLLENTGNVMRVEADGKIHIFKPVTTGTDYDYEYALESGHAFFSKAYRQRLVVPNYIVVQSQEDDDPQYSGYAVDSESYDLIPKKAFQQMRLTSNEQATAIAEALLLYEQLWSEMGSADVPMNIGADIWDYVKVGAFTSKDVYRVGNTGHITRHWNGEKQEWRMTFSFGNWMTIEKALGNLGLGSDAVDELEKYFSRLKAKHAYIENLLVEQIDAVWIDDEGNIDLDKIGDTIDNLQDGEYFCRARWLHLDGETGLTMKEQQVYYIRFTPDSDETTIRRQDTAPSGPDTGEYWIDTSGENPIIKRWTGSTWFTIDQDEINMLNAGILTTHTKLANLSVDGLVLLDEVVEGTHGLILAADLSAGHLKLTSNTVIDGDWYDESGVDINAATGITIYGTAGALRTRAEKDGADQCYVGSDGKIYAGAGAVWLASDGLTIKGQFLKLQNSSGTLRGYLYGGTNYLTIAGYLAGILLSPGTGQNVILDGGHFIPSTDATRDLGTDTFRFKTVFAHELDLSDGYIDLPRRASHPAAKEGRMYLNSGDNNIYAYINGSWQTLHNY